MGEWTWRWLHSVKNSAIYTWFKPHSSLGFDDINIDCHDVDIGMQRAQSVSAAVPTPRESLHVLLHWLQMFGGAGINADQMGFFSPACVVRLAKTSTKKQWQHHSYATKRATMKQKKKRSRKTEAAAWRVSQYHLCSGSSSSSLHPKCIRRCQTQSCRSRATAGSGLGWWLCTQGKKRGGGEEGMVRMNHGNWH